MNHLSPEQLSAHVDGALAGDDLRRADAHLAGCAACREARADLAASDAALARALEHDPGDAYFESFAARVAERIEAEAAPAAPAAAAPRPRRAAPWTDFGSWFRSPARLAWAGGVAAVVVGAGVVLMLSRETGAPDLRDPEILGRSAQTAPDPAASAPMAERAPGEGAERAEARDAAPMDADANLDARSNEIQEAAPRAALPGRAREMRRVPGGEDVPAGPSPVPSFARPPEERTATSRAESSTVRRPQVVSPLAAGSSAGEKEETAKATAKSAPATRGIRQDALRMQAEDAAHSCGSVVDARGRPVANAQVVVGDRGITATTDANGRFCIDLPSGTYDVSVFAVGYAPNRHQVELGGAEEPRLAVRTVDVLPPPASPVPPSALTERSAARLPGVPAPSPLPAMPDSVRALWQQAEEAVAEAEAARSAVRLDNAALAWNAVIARLAPGAAEILARERLARARVRAWELVPDGPRTLAARGALESFIARSPDGPARTWARGALERLGP